MATNSGLVALVAYVRGYFSARGITATVSLGWKQPTQQINQGPGGANRVVFIPSDPTGRGGKLSPTQQPGPRTFGTPPADISARALYTWERFVVVSVWAADGSRPHDEEAQIEAVEDLFEHTIQAVHAFGHNDARWGDVAWTTSPVEHVFGRELRAGLTFRHPMFDAPTGIAYPKPAITKTLTGELRDEDDVVTLHFDTVNVIGAPVAGTPGTADPTAMAHFGQLNVHIPKTISVIHAHLPKGGSSGTATVEVYRRRAGVMTLLTTISITSADGASFVTKGATPVGDLAVAQAGDYLYAQLTSANLTGSAGLTVDVHF